MGRGSMPGTREHDVARDTALSWGRGMTGKARAELGWRGNTEAASPRPEEEPLVPGSPHLPWPPRVLSLRVLCVYLTCC